MSASIARILKIRHVLEESSRLELARRVALATQIEGAQEREIASWHESRLQVLETVVDESLPEQQRAHRRSLEWTNAKSATVRRQMLWAMAEAAESRVIEARMIFLGCRTARQQVESLLEADEARARDEQERRTQRDLDEWFSFKQSRQKRNPLRNGPQF